MLQALDRSNDPTEARTSTGPLAGVRVLDLSRFLSGPQATLFLAGLGAEVIRIDDPASGDPTFNAPPYLGPEGVSFERKRDEDVGIAYLKRARGKKAISLNLKDPRGHELFMQLVEKADVVVENFRVGVTERLGIDYSKLAERNPRLIHCAITGYGSTGPESRRKAFDLMVQAASGLMSITGAPDGQPSKTGSSLSDGIAGAFALSGVLAALYQREATGRGQFVDVSMADCLVSLIYDEPFDCYAELGIPSRQGNRIARFSPFNSYPTKDGSVTIGAGTDADWRALLEVMQRSDLLLSPPHMKPGWRLANNKEIDQIVSAWTGDHSTDEVIAALDARDVPCGPIRPIEDVPRWDQMAARAMLSPLVNPLAPSASGAVAAGFPMKFSAAAAGHDAPPPLSREHNVAIFKDLLGLDTNDMAELADAGVI